MSFHDLAGVLSARSRLLKIERPLAQILAQRGRANTGVAHAAPVIIIISQISNRSRLFISIGFTSTRAPSTALVLPRLTCSVPRAGTTDKETVVLIAMQNREAPYVKICSHNLLHRTLRSRSVIHVHRPRQCCQNSRQNSRPK